MDLDPVAPFARQRLTHALSVVGFASLGSLFSLDRGFGVAVGAFVGGALVLGAVGLLLPVLGVRKRVRAAKAEQPGWVGAVPGIVRWPRRMSSGAVPFKTRSGRWVGVLVCLISLLDVVPLSGQQATGDVLEVGGDRIYYETAGAGPPVVLLHDGLTHSGIWGAQFRAFAVGHRVVRYDRRGYGRSDVAAHPYSAVEDLEALLDHLGIERAVLVGASSGGRLAIDYALASPDRVSGLVLVGAVVSGYGYSDHFRERGRRNMAPLSEGDVEGALSNWVEDPYLLGTRDREIRARLRTLMEPYARKRFLRYDPALERAPQPPALDRLDRIRVPTLVVVGAQDIADVHAHAGVLEAGIEGAERVVVPDAGHLVAFERSDEFNTLVFRFLRSL